MQTSVQLPQMTKTNAIIISLSAAIFILDSTLKQLGGFSLNPLLGLSLGGMLQGFVFQLLSYPFAPSSFFQVLFSGLILWFLGCELERQWGRAPYLFMIFMSSLIGGVIYLIIGSIFFSSQAVSILTLSGLAGVSSGLCLIYAILYPDRQFVFMFLFPMKAKYFCLLLIGITLYQGVFSPGGVLAWGHLGVMLGAYISFRLLLLQPVKIYLARVASSFETLFNQASKGGGFSAPGRASKRKGNLRIVKNNEDDDETRPPKYWQ